MEYLKTQGFLTQNRMNIDVSSSDFVIGTDLIGVNFFVIDCPDVCKLKVKTLGGQIDVFDFQSGTDPGLYTAVYADGENTITELNIRY
jgi:hypothetical protein